MDLQVGPDGDLFYVDFTGGTVHRIAYSAQNTPPRAAALAVPASGLAPLTVQFDGTASSDAEDGTLTFDWDLTGDGVFGDSALGRPTSAYGANGTRTVSLRVTDSGGLSDVVTLPVVVGDTAPVPLIDTPLATLRWRVGQSITFSGRASDGQQGSLPAAGLAWTLVMNHCQTLSSCHEHPIQTVTGVRSGSFAWRPITSTRPT